MTMRTTTTTTVARRTYLEPGEYPGEPIRVHNGQPGEVFAPNQITEELVRSSELSESLYRVHVFGMRLREDGTHHTTSRSQRRYSVAVGGTPLRLLPAEVQEYLIGETALRLEVAL